MQSQTNTQFIDQFSEEELEQLKKNVAKEIIRTIGIYVGGHILIAVAGHFLKKHFGE